jgi:hypothetical protein
MADRLDKGNGHMVTPGAMRGSVHCGVRPAVCGQLGLPAFFPWHILGTVRGSLHCFWVAALLLATSSCARPGKGTLTSGGVAWEVLDGAWGTDGDSLIGSGGRVETAADYDDATIELDVEQYVDSGERNVGIGFRSALTDYDPRKTNGYEVNWTSTRRLNEFVSSANVSNPLHRAWLSSPALQPLKNHVIVRARGSVFIVEVNGMAVDSFSDDEYTHGHVRLWVESSTQAVRFSHVRITPG